MKYRKIIIPCVLALILVSILQAQNPPLVAEVTTDAWQPVVIDSKLPVFIFFYSDNCRPCEQQYPLVEDLAKEYAGKVKFAKINIIDSYELRVAFNILRAPTMWVMKASEKTIFTNSDDFLDKPALKKFLEDGLARKFGKP